MLEAHDQSGPSEQKTHKKALCVLIDAHTSSGRYHHKLLCAHFVPVTSLQFKGGRGPLLPERLGLVLDIASRKSSAKTPHACRRRLPGCLFRNGKSRCHCHTCHMLASSLIRCIHQRLENKSTTLTVSELRSCVKVEVAVPGSPSRTVTDLSITIKTAVKKKSSYKALFFNRS